MGWLWGGRKLPEERNSRMISGRSMAWGDIGKDEVMGRRSNQPHEGAKGGRHRAKNPAPKHDRGKRK